MRVPLCAGFVLALLLSGCVSYHRTVADGGLAFPLAYCWDSQDPPDDVPKRLATAAQKLTAVDMPLNFSNEWVCRTAPVTKPPGTASRPLSSPAAAVTKVQVAVSNESAVEAKTRENKIALVSSEEVDGSPST